MRLPGVMLDAGDEDVDADADFANRREITQSS